MAVGRAVVVPKGLVEDCLTLRPSDLFDGKRPPAGPYTAAITWRSRSGAERASISFTLDASASPPWLRLEYRANGEPFSIQVGLPTTPLRFGGVRWWFACPSCRQRCDRLYLPDHGRRFACRKCWNLGYRSQRESDARVRALLRCPEYLESLRAGPAIKHMNVRQLGQALRVIRAMDARWDRFERRFRRPSR
jgi:hypothetical protein